MKVQHFFSRAILIGMVLLIATSAWSDQPDPGDRFGPQIPGLMTEKMSDDNLNTTWMGAWAHGPCYAVAVHGEYAYFGDGSYLKIADISNPASPVEVGKVLLPDEVKGVALTEGYAYVASDESGLRIIDVSNPAAPFEAGDFDTSGHAFDVFVSGNYAYVADYGSGLCIIDLSNPAAPFEAGYFYMGGCS